MQTIAAITTASGPAAIAVVRMSGPDSYTVADRLLPRCNPIPSRRAANTFAYAQLVHPVSGESIDGVIALFFRATRSYTGEDCIEFQGHGGFINARRMLEAVCAAGVRQAEPGEFTRRALLNGKMDVLQAEAVLNLVQASSRRAASMASAQIEGALSQRILTLYERLCQLQAELEHALDIDEQDVDEPERIRFRKALTPTVRQVCRLLRSWYAGRVLHEGARVVLSGPPNSGKSTLFNALLEHDRAIVSPVPGTTRDTIEETLLIDGFPIQLIDTAGLRPSECRLEQQGMARSHTAIEEAAVNLWILDGSVSVDLEIERMPGRLEKERTVWVVNKADKPLRMQGAALRALNPVYCSAKTGQGLESLKQRLMHVLHLDVARMPDIAITTWQRDVLQQVLRGLLAARTSMDRALPDLVLTAHVLRQSNEVLGGLLGRQYREDVLDTLLSRFCVGK